MPANRSRQIPGLSPAGRRAGFPGPAGHAHRQRGFILLPVVLAICLVATIAFLISSESATETGRAGGELEAERAGYLAEAGLNHGLWQAEQQGCGPYANLADVALGAGSYSTTLTAATGSTSSYRISVDQDTWVRSDNPSEGHPDDSRLAVSLVSGARMRAFIHYDLSAIPDSSDIVAATAWFHVETAHPDGTVNIHGLTADWTAADATWETLGDSLDQPVLGTIPAQAASGVWVPVNLRAQVQAWVNGLANYGIALDAGIDGVDAEYGSGESAQSPYLEVVVGTIAATAKLESVGTLAGGIGKTRSRASISLRQQPAGFFFSQPDADKGIDTQVYQLQPGYNFGTSANLRVENLYPGGWANALLKFDVSAIPVGASISGASLELFQNSASTSGGDFAIHQVTVDWEEGAESGGIGASSWLQRNTSTTWTMPGGDYAPAPVASLSVAPGQAWHRWDISALVQDWVSGEQATLGLAVVPSSAGSNAIFSSSDDINPGLRPKLTVTYGCACDSTCLGPQGSGRLLMVVTDPNTLVPLDARKKALFESWGYTVNVLDDSASQAGYDSAIAAADAVFISETVTSNQVGTHLLAAPIGVVSQDGTYNADLGFAGGGALVVGSAISITDSSHFITAPFVGGPLVIYEGGMQQLTVSAAAAPGLQTLAVTGGAGSLVVLDQGATLVGGGKAAGRRVMLPLGPDSGFNWNYLNGNGRLLLQRALAWAMASVDTPAPMAQLLFVASGATPTPQELTRIALIESWGYRVTVIDDNDSQAEFDTAAATSEVAYISSRVDAATLAGKLANAAIGVVNEQAELVETLGFGAPSIVYQNRDQVDLIDSNHYITAAFATGLLPVATSPQNLLMMTGTVAPGFEPLANVLNYGSVYDVSLGTVDAGGELYGGGNAAGRRVLLPWGDVSFDATQLNANGRTIMQRAIEWARGAPTLAKSYLDQFNNLSCDAAIDYTGSDGTLDWSGFQWQELDDGNPCSGDVSLLLESGSHRLAVTGNGSWIQRGVDLSGFTDAALIFDYQQQGTFDSSHYLAIGVSGDNGTTWTEVGRIDAAGDGSYQSASYPVPAVLVNANTVIRFTATDLTVSRMIYLDNVMIIEGGVGSVGSSDGSGDAPVPGYRDGFNTDKSYAGDDGSLNWSTDWLEINESDGAGKGDLRVLADISDFQLQIKDMGTGSGEGVEREADLSACTTAVLQFDYRRELLDEASDYVTVDVSANGGASWVELDRIAGPASDSTYQASNPIDLDGYMAANSRIRFMSSPTLGDREIVFFDNVEIACR